MAGAWADLASALPIFAGLQIAGPEWPGAALAGASGVNSATNTFVVKHTIAVSFLTQTAASMLDASICADHMLERFVQQLGNRLDFLVRDPDEARRAGTAVAAHRAAKAQAGMIPSLLGVDFDAHAMILAGKDV